METFGRLVAQRCERNWEKASCCDGMTAPLARLCLLYEPNINPMLIQFCVQVRGGSMAGQNRSDHIRKALRGSASRSNMVLGFRLVGITP